MIIWINGAFGAGKTTVAYELHHRLPQSFLFDPEKIGYFIRKNYPSSLLTLDFQDHGLWRKLTYRYLLEMSQQYKEPIIVPMTIVNQQYFDEIIGRLRQQHTEVQHYTLIASKETLLTRLKRRGNGKHSWPAQQIDRCIASLSNEKFSSHIHTDQLTPEQIISFIATDLQLAVEEDKRNSIKKRLDRLIIQLRQ